MVSLTPRKTLAGHVFLYAWQERNEDSNPVATIQGVSGGIVNILEGGSMDCSGLISLYKHVSNFQWVWRYSCLKLARTDPIFVCGDGRKAKSTKKK